VTVPFAIGYRPLFSGLGVVAAYLAALLGLTFYMRRRIGARLWRKAHRATVLVYVLGVVHALGAGTDASTPWLRVFLLLTGAPIAVLFLRRVLVRSARGPAQPGGTECPPSTLRTARTASRASIAMGTAAAEGRSSGVRGAPARIVR
jgi:sulfoxide reductase heme-binding subunit YedZ